MISFYDSAQLTDERKRTKDGYLATTGRVARGDNIQLYLADEVQGALDNGFNHGDVIRMFRPASEVFSKETMQSFAHRPVTLGHPSHDVSSETWKDDAAGHSGDHVARDGDYIRVPMLLMDEEAIKAVENGTVELSMGYSVDIDWTAGEFDGKQYDAIQRNIRNNHIAIVDSARAGHGARIGDRHDPKITTVPHHNKETIMAQMQTVVIDGVSIEATQQAAQVIDKLQAQIKDSAKTLTDAQNEHQKLIDAKDAEIAKRDGEIENLKKQVMTADQLDAAVKQRTELLATATKVADIDYAGMNDKDIRKAAVTAVVGDEAIKDKSEAYIEARFDVLAENINTVHDNAPAKPAIKDANDARNAYLARIHNGGVAVKQEA